MESMKLNFGVLIADVSRAILQIQDSRKTSNATRYSLKAAILGRFSVFFMQSESFLEHQGHLERHQVSSNAQTLFRMIQIPSVSQICNIVDAILAKGLFEVFAWVYLGLQQGGHADFGAYGTN